LKSRSKSEGPREIREAGAEAEEAEEAGAEAEAEAEAGAEAEEAEEAVAEAGAEAEAEAEAGAEAEEAEEAVAEAGAEAEAEAEEAEEAGAEAEAEEAVAEEAEEAEAEAEEAEEAEAEDWWAVAEDWWAVERVASELIIINQGNQSVDRSVVGLWLNPWTRGSKLSRIPRLFAKELEYHKHGDGESDLLAGARFRLQPFPDEPRRVPVCRSETGER
jgi:hypothetical protein